MVGLTIEEAAAAGLDTNPRCGNGPPGLQAVLWKLSPTSDENLIDAAMPAESPEPGTGLILGTAFRRRAAARVAPRGGDRPSRCLLPIDRCNAIYQDPDPRKPQKLAS